MAAAGMGVAYFLEMIAEARRAVPSVPSLAVLDCGDAPGLALGALRMGAEAVRLEAPPMVLAKVSDIAAQTGAKLIPADEDVSL